MSGYIFRRALISFLTVLGILVAVFLMTQVIGDPVRYMLFEGIASPEQVAAVRHQLGLDLPLMLQLWNFFRDILTGDFGYSWVTGRPALTVLMEKFPNTLRLAALATGIAIGIAIPVGLYCAYRSSSILDYVMRGIAFVGQSVPIFWIALMFILLFAIRFPIFPAGGKAGWESIVLPTAALSIFLTAAQIRLVRSSALEILQSDYIKLAKLKGLPTWLIMLKHVLRNAGVTLITFMGMQFAMLVTRSVVVESVFGWPGFGRELLIAIYNRDFPVLRAGIIFGCSLFIFIQFVIDITYAWLNPEVKLRRRGR